jgi:branched-chain amino acid transport system permease protein
MRCITGQAFGDWLRANDQSLGCCWWKMPLEIFVVTLINGLELGMIYALVAVGFSFIYSTARVLFCAHGEIYMVGAYGTYLLTQRIGFPYFPTVLVIMVGLGLAGLVLERFLFRPFYENSFVTFILSFALAILISNIFLLLFGGQIRNVATPFPGSISLFEMKLPKEKIVVFFTAVAIFWALSWFLNNVKEGQAIRAVAQDREVASLQGIDINRSMQMVFFISFGLAGAAGALVAPIYYVDVFLGTPALMNAFIVVILGGMGSFLGAIAAGLFLGVIQSFAGIFIGGTTLLVSFIVVIIFLVLRPQGFFGRE